MEIVHPLLADYPVIVSLPVQWGDQDAFGHVNNTVHFRWFETVRIAYLERIGLWGMLDTEGLGPIVAAQSCDYRVPVHYPDTVLVGARISRIGTSSVRMQHAAVSTALDTLVAESDSTLVLFDYRRRRATPIGENFRAAIEGLESKPVGA